MRAVVFHQHGGPEVLQYEEAPEPKVGPRDVLIRVKAASCNYNDIWARKGLPGMRFDLPHISGSDVAGEVVETGPGVRGVEKGQRVLSHPALSCRTCEACTSGQEYFCRQFKIWGFQTGPYDGGYAELARLPETNVIPVPSNMSFEQAGAIPLVLLTAYHMLVTRAQLEAGEDVLIWGASSGVGHVAIQIAKVIGARVIAVAGTDTKCMKALGLGADDAINYKSQDVVSEVKRLTDKKGVEVVFEHTGQATWERSISSMAWGGRLVVCGNTTGFEAKTDLRFLFNKQLSLLGSHQGTKAELLKGLRWVEAGKVRPVIDRTYPLRDAAKAQQAMEAGQHFGKIMLKP